MRRTLLLSFVIAVLGVGVAHGRECKGINFPEQAQVEGSNLTLNGLGLRQATMFKVNVYVAALYVAKPSSDPIAILGSAGPTRLILKLGRTWAAAISGKPWDKGFSKNAKERLPDLRERIISLNGWMVDVKAGQRLTFFHKPGAGIQV